MSTGDKNCVPSQGKATRAFHLGALLWALVCLGVTGCQRGARNPEDAYQAFAQAVRAGSLEATFETLDQKTRWAWMTVQRCHRESYDIVLSNFPEGADKDTKLKHFQAGAVTENAALLFAERTGRAGMKELLQQLPDEPKLKRDGERASVRSRGGHELPFQFHDSRWGYAGFQVAALDAEKRAVADLEMIRSSATDHERAARRGKP